MNKKYSFFLKPVAKPRMTKRDVWLDPPRKSVLQYRLFSDAMKYEANKQKMPYLPGAIRIIFFVKMPDSYSKKRKSKLDGEPRKLQPDIDNYLKSILDIFCRNDGYVWKVEMEKYHSQQNLITIEFL